METTSPVEAGKSPVNEGQPLSRSALFRFTPEIAREMTKRAHEARMRNKALRAMVNDPKPAFNGEKRTEVVLDLVARAKVVEKLIKQTELALQSYLTQPHPHPKDTTLDLGPDGKTLQSLSQTIKNLYEVWSLLTGHEKPGIRKSKSVRGNLTLYTVPTPIDT